MIFFEALQYQYTQAFSLYFITYIAFYFHFQTFTPPNILFS